MTGLTLVRSGSILYCSTSARQDLLRLCRSGSDGFCSVNTTFVLQMAEPLPETSFEQATQEARDKERLERQKLLVSLPRSKLEQDILAHLAEKLAKLREETKDLLLWAITVEGAAVRMRLVQGLRSLGAKNAQLMKTSMIAAKEGCTTAEQVFILAPTYMEVDDAEARLLEKARREQEARKKKEAAKSDSSWKMLNAKKSSPYGYSKPGFSGGYGSGYGGGGSGLGNWALQQLFSQQLQQGLTSGGSGKKATSKMGQPVGGPSGQQDAGYAARMAAGRLQYPCHGCGVHGHWKKDGKCNPADVAAYIKKKMADQAKKDAEEEEGEDSGKNIYWLSSPHSKLYTSLFHVYYFFPQKFSFLFVTGIVTVIL